MLSLLGMVLAIGLVVDDAIVVVENVERQLENGLPPFGPRKAAMAEVTGPIIATTAVLMAVFVPVAFIPGVTGTALQSVRADGRDLGRHFGLQLADAQSGLERGFPASPAAERFRAVPLVQCRIRAAVAWLCRMRARLIGWRWAVLALFVVVLGGTFFLSQRIPSSFLPVEDQGYFFVVIQLPDGASLQRTDAVAEKVRGVLGGHAGRRHRRLDQRLELPHQRRAVEFGGRVRNPQAMGRAAGVAERVAKSSPMSG